MKRCLYLAKLGKGNVAPNPMVGSVIVHNDIIIGEGYHQKCGEAHAEVNAINSVADKSLLSNSTIYVNLEPCAHFGKTPPCSNLIIDSNIPRVVIGCIDSYSEVAGKGIEKMEKAGINVTVRVLEKESIDLNKRFFTFHNQQRPYIILKWAQSANGFMDIDRVGVRQAHPTVNRQAHPTTNPRDNSILETKKGIFWITQPETKSLVHKWRAEEAGILVGRKTIENDNPSLTCREYKGDNPTRIILDKGLKTKYSEFTISNDGVKTIILNELESKTEKNIEYIKLDHFSMETILKELYNQNIQSIIVEGGKFTLEQFINKGLWDEARILTGIGNIENGIKAPMIEGDLKNSYAFGNDLVEVFEKN